MFGLIKTWKALEARGIMGINRRNADYVLKYNKRSLYPIVDDKIITKERAIAAGIHVPEMYGVIETEKQIDKLHEIIGGRSDFVIKPAQGAGGDGILVIADMRGVPGLDLLRQQLQDSGMTLQEETDITQNVLAAIEAEDPIKKDRIRRLAPGWMKGAFEEFAGVKHSAVHRDLESRDLIYYRWKLQKSALPE